MSATNIILALDVILRLSAKAQQLATVVRQAQTEGRDITQEELGEAKADAQKAVDSLNDALKE